jgi:antitoxin (DNA-binding transcriptional repressor) of toxin-antitoxin stability system
MYSSHMSTVTVSEARAALPDLLNRVDAGEEVIITRHGHPVAVVLRPDALRTRRADVALAGAAKVRTLLEAGRRSPLPVDGLSEDRADALIAEIRTGRADH